jgi:hypothetical protein
MGLHRNDVTDALAAMQAGVMPLPDPAKFNPIKPDMDPEVQTDKEAVKIIGCRECARPLVVTTFFAAAKGVCRVCKGETGTVASVGQPVPGQTDPTKAVNLADCLVNKHFAHALCPVHPDNEEHEMELKQIAHSDHYGPGEFVLTKDGRIWKQTAPGETAMHQCTKCNATVVYSTQHVVQFRRQNEVIDRPDLGAPHRNSALGIRGDDPTKIQPVAA